MGAAQQELDRIHEAEEAARKRIEDAKAKVRDMKSKTEKDFQQIIDKEVKEATMEAERLLKERKDKRVSIEGSIQKKMDKSVEELRGRVASMKKDAVNEVVRILLGEE